MPVTQMASIYAKLDKFVGASDTSITVPASVTKQLNKMTVGDVTFLTLTAHNTSMPSEQREVVKYTHTAPLSGNVINVTRGVSPVSFHGCEAVLSGELTEEMLDEWYVKKGDVAGVFKTCNGAPHQEGNAIPTCEETDTKISTAISNIQFPTPPQIPTSLPPSGPAGGALSGTYPNPDIKASAVYELLKGCNNQSIPNGASLVSCEDFNTFKTATNTTLQTHTDQIAALQGGGGGVTQRFRPVVKRIPIASVVQGGTTQDPSGTGTLDVFDIPYTPREGYTYQFRFSLLFSMIGSNPAIPPGQVRNGALYIPRATSTAPVATRGFKVADGGTGAYTNETYETSTYNYNELDLNNFKIKVTTDVYDPIQETTMYLGVVLVEYGIEAY